MAARRWRRRPQSELVPRAVSPLCAAPHINQSTFLHTPQTCPGLWGEGSGPTGTAAGTWLRRVSLPPVAVGRRPPLSAAVRHRLSRGPSDGSDRCRLPGDAASPVIHPRRAVSRGRACGVGNREMWPMST